MPGGAELGSAGAFGKREEGPTPDGAVLIVSLLSALFSLLLPLPTVVWPLWGRGKVAGKLKHMGAFTS